MVDRLVLLTLGGVDLQLAEQRVHAERARLVGDDRHDALAELLVAGEVAQQAGEAHRGADRLVARAAEQLGERLLVGKLAVPCGRARLRFGIEPPSALRRSIMYWYSIESSAGRKYGGSVAVERRLGDLVVHVQPVAEHEQLLLGHLLDLVRGVAPLDLGTERPALDRLAQDHGRHAGAEVLGRRLVRRVQLAVVVAAAGQVDEILVAEVGDHLAQPRIGPEEVVADVGAVARPL